MLLCVLFLWLTSLLPLLTPLRSLFDARGNRDSAGNTHHSHASKQPFTICSSNSTEFFFYYRFLWLLRWKMTAASFVETCSAPWSKCFVHLDTGQKVAHEQFLHQSLSLKSIFLGKLFVRNVAMLWRELLPLRIASRASSAASEARASSKCLRCSIPCTNLSAVHPIIKKCTRLFSYSWSLILLPKSPSPNHKILQLGLML